jgi:signal transduction histidine kinase
MPTSLDTNINTLLGELTTLIAQKKFTNALTIAENLCEVQPNNVLYIKTLADIYFELAHYKFAMDNYLLYFQKIDSLISISWFRQKYEKIKMHLSKEVINEYNSSIKQLIEANKISPNISKQLLGIISSVDAYEQPQKKNVQKENIVQIKPMNNKIPDEQQKIKQLQVLEKSKQFDTIYNELITYFKNSSNITRKSLIADWGIAFYERHEKYQEAVDQIILILQKIKDEVLIGTLFRICRKRNNYEVAEKIMKLHKISVREDSFHILYGLVFYYEHKKDEKSLNEVLLRIERRFADSVPTQSTLRNIYIQLQRFEDAKRVSNHITLINRNKFGVELADSADEIVEILENQVISQNQTKFIQELIRGFSHEMGQPITNIRFNIQYYSRVLKNNFSEEQVLKIFDTILTETERMADLADQLKPLISYKENNIKYDVLDLIKKRITTEQARLTEFNIDVIIRNDNHINTNIFGSVTKMEQIINNLLVNAIDAMTETVSEQVKRQLIIEVIHSKNKKFIAINFKDTGKGISPDILDKIFTIYFTTKTNKGQGLGLFIVKNLLQAQGGDISLDQEYKQGACFKLIIPKTSKNFTPNGKI